MPPSTMTSASETLAQVTPIAPKSIWRRAIQGDLWPLEWGRQALPPAAMADDRRSTLASNRPRSSRRDGVSSSAFGRPMRGSVAAALVVATSLPAGRDGAGTVRPGERHCRLSTIAAHGDHDGGRRLGGVLGCADGAGQRALGLVHRGGRAGRRHGPGDLPAGHGSRGSRRARRRVRVDQRRRRLGAALPRPVRTRLGWLAGRGARLVRDGADTRRAHRVRCCGPIARTRATRGSIR